jgi:hypothetical protein
MKQQKETHQQSADPLQKEAQLPAAIATSNLIAQSMVKQKISARHKLNRKDED